MWIGANESHIEQQLTEENGWQLLDGQYKPVWFDGQQLPDSLVPEEGEVEELQKEAEDDMEIASSDEEESSDEED